MSFSHTREIDLMPPKITIATKSTTNNPTITCKRDVSNKPNTENVSVAMETSPATETIASESEFTPKNIQTRNTRANLVYAVKIAVENDGRLKIGLYGEVNL